LEPAAAGGQRFALPGLSRPLYLPGLPATAFTSDVSYANVSTELAIASELTSSAWTLMLPTSV